MVSSILRYFYLLTTFLVYWFILIAPLSFDLTKHYNIMLNSSYAAVHCHWIGINVLEWMLYPSATVEISAGSQWQHYQCLMYHCCHPGNGNCHVIMRDPMGELILLLTHCTENSLLSFYGGPSMRVLMNSVCRAWTNIYTHRKRSLPDSSEAKWAS